MEQENNNCRIKGISVSNPVDVEKDYLLYTVEFAAKNNLNHIQFIGPIHDHVKGNIDGMVLYRKYSRFNEGKDMDYIMTALDAIREACRLAKRHGIRTYVWHHELELPLKLKEVYPEIKNACGDIEVTHPIVKDFLENKIQDFFHSYPNIDGIILTLHETSVPLLKLKEQKLGEMERVQYVTKILYDCCASLGKELIVRPFASIEEDYEKMTQAYEEVSTDMVIMDKWTQFDWSLTQPHNAFYRKIKKNPLLVEADVFGEFFGKGRLPLMLKSHIAEKFEYCDQFRPKGYVARIDRGGAVPFGCANEVNVVITAAHLNGKNVDVEIDTFFENRYPGVGKKVRSLMEPTEEILKKTIYTKGFYYSELSFFPTLNHSKNHFYFEMMRENYRIESDEWFIPKNWNRGTLQEMLEEKQEAVQEATRLYEEVIRLKGRMGQKMYHNLWTQFANLKLVTEIWLIMTEAYMNYVRYFETEDTSFQAGFEHALERLAEKNRKGIRELGEDFYCLNCEWVQGAVSNIDVFVEDVKQSFVLEKKAYEQLRKEPDLTDFIICGGAMEGHGLKKEVNFSDTMVRNGALCRIPGSLRGIEWCSINAHGWFSYEIAVKPYDSNCLEVEMGGFDGVLDVLIAIDGKTYEVHDEVSERKCYQIPFREEDGRTKVRLQFDRLSEHMPVIYTIKVRE